MGISVACILAMTPCDIESGMWQVRWQVTGGFRVCSLCGAARMRESPLRATLSKLAARGDAHLLPRRAAARADALDGLDHVHALGHLAEDAVLAVEEGRVARADEELRAVGAATSACAEGSHGRVGCHAYLRAVGVGARVGHAQRARPAMADLEVLVVEFPAID